MISQSGLGSFLAPDEKYFVFNCFGGCWKRHVLQHMAGVGHMQNLYLTILTFCFFLIPKGPFWRVYRAIIRGTFIFRPTFYFTQHQPREFRAYFYFMCSLQDGMRHIRLLKCPHIFKDFHLFIDTVLFSLKLWRSSAFLPHLFHVFIFMFTFFLVSLEYRKNTSERVVAFSKNLSIFHGPYCKEHRCQMPQSYHLPHD